MLRSQPFGYLVSINSYIMGILFQFRHQKQNYKLYEESSMKILSFYKPSEIL